MSNNGIYKQFKNTLIIQLEIYFKVKIIGRKNCLMLNFDAKKYTLK